MVTAYKAGGLEEISLNVGQLVHITEKDSNGWWRGELQVGFQIGLADTFKGSYNSLCFSDFNF